MKDPGIRLALLGVGRWGNHLLRNFLTLPAAQVVAVVEQNSHRHPQIREQFDLTADIELTAIAEPILTRTDIDAVAIATPAVTHYGLIKTALETGKHVLAEKPLTLTLAEAKTLTTLAAEQQRQLVVDHTYLFHPAVQAGQQVLQRQPIGPLRYGYATRTNLGPVRPDVDALWDLAIHDIAIFNHWIGEFPVAVAAQGHSWLQTEAPSRHFSSGLVDVAWLQLAYASGFQATIHVCWANADKQRRLCVVGDRGTLIFDEMQPAAPLVLQRGAFVQEGLFYQPHGLTRETIPLATGEPLRQVCMHFLNCVTANQPSDISSGNVGMELVKILVALSASLEQGGKFVDVGESKL